MQTTGVFKLIEIKRKGETTNNKEKYIHVLAVDFFNQKKEGEEGRADFFMVKAFGSTADFIERNMNGTRRAFITGETILSHYTDKVSVEKKITFNGQTGKVKFDVEVDKTSLSLNVSSIRFLDKPNETAGITFTPDEGGEEVVFVVEDNDQPTDEPAGSYTVEVEGKPEGRERKSKLAGRK